MVVGDSVDNLDFLIESSEVASMHADMAYFVELLASSSADTLTTHQRNCTAVAFKNLVRPLRSAVEALTTQEQQDQKTSPDSVDNKFEAICNSYVSLVRDTGKAECVRALRMADKIMRQERQRPNPNTELMVCLSLYALLSFHTDANVRGRCVVGVL